MIAGASLSKNTIKHIHQSPMIRHNDQYKQLNYDDIIKVDPFLRMVTSFFEMYLINNFNSLNKGRWPHSGKQR